MVLLNVGFTIRRRNLEDHDFLHRLETPKSCSWMAVLKKN